MLNTFNLKNDIKGTSVLVSKETLPESSIWAQQLKAQKEEVRTGAVAVGSLYKGMGHTSPFCCKTSC